MASQPKEFQDWPALLSEALALGDEDVALEIAKIIQQNAPNDPRHALVVAERFSRLGRSDVALSMVETVSQTSPPNPAINYFIGVFAGHVGQLEKSKTNLRSAIAKKHNFGDAWAMLGAANGLEAKDEATLQALLKEAHPHAMPGVTYALGSFYHASGQYEDAMNALNVANAFERKKQAFNIDAELAAMDDIIASHKHIIAPTAQSESARPHPVFVVGSPRSGTSLTEQVISAAANVTALGETMLSRLCTWSLGNLGHASLEHAGAFSPGHTNWNKIGQVYKILAQQRAPEAQFTTDKGTLLHLFVGVLAYALPDAKFVLVKRNPRDVALSAYRAYLGGGNRWRHDFKDAAKFLSAHASCLDFWANEFPDRTFSLDYDEFVHAPKPKSDALTKFLGLPELDINATDFSRSNVPTASFAQIRSKIGPGSSGGWVKYRQWIDPAFTDVV